MNTSNSERRIVLTLCAAVVACVLEGSVRKWLLPPGSSLRYLAYFSKDIILASCLLSTVPVNPTALISKAYSVVTFGVAIFIVGAIIGGASELNPVGAVLTLRACVFLPLVSLTIASRLSRNAYYYVCMTMVALVAVNAALGFVQFFSSPGSIVNKYASEMDIATATYAERVRATGTFSYLAGYGIFSCAAVAVGLMLVSSGTKLRQSQLGYATILAGLICAGATASRGVAVSVILELAVWVVFGLKRASSIISAMVALLVAFTLVYVFEKTDQTIEILSAAQKRHAAVSDDMFARIYAIFDSVPLAVDLAPFGIGLGTQQVAGAYYATGQMGFTSFEGEWPRIVMEAGVLGLLGSLIIHGGMVANLIFAWYDCKHPRTRAIYLTCAVLCLLWGVGGVVFNHVTSFFFWIFVIIALSADARLAPDATNQPTWTPKPGGS